MCCDLIIVPDGGSGPAGDVANIKNYPYFGALLTSNTPWEMKRIAFVLLTALSNLCLHAQWRTIYQGTDSLNPIVSASFYAPANGYIATNQWIGLTADSGHSYQQVYVTNSNVNYEGNSVNLTFGFLPSDIQAFSSSTLVVSGNYGYEPSILYSTDGGADWQLAYHRSLPGTNAASNSVYQMSFPGAGSTGYAVQNNEIIKSTNGGQTWATLVATNGATFTLSAPDVNTVYVASPTALYKTTNGGSSWTSNTVPFTIQVMTAYSNTHVYAVTPLGDTYSSTDGGNTWQPANSLTGRMTSSYINSIHFIADSIGYVCGSAVYQTRNSGMSWELMPGSTPSKGYVAWERLVFYNNQQIWLPGYGLTLDLTTNGGGISYPRALFDINTSQVCASNTVQLVNQGQPGETYAWYRNRVLLGTTYNVSYTAPTGNDTIKLVVSNNGLSDSVTQVVNAASLSTFALNSGVQDTACDNATLRFFIYNSDPSTTYQVKRACCYISSPIPGTGGTFSMPYYLNPGEDSTSTFTVYAYRTTSCGNDSATQSFRVTIQIPNPPTTALKDTFCNQNSFYIKVPNSRIGYQYWAGSSAAMVGTGDTISLPCVASQATWSTNIDSYGYMKYYSFPIYVASVSAEGCGGTLVAYDTLVERTPDVNFDIHGYSWFTGDTLALINETTYATNYLWTPGAGGTPASSTLVTPPLTFSTAGYQTIGLQAYSLEGCTDSMQRVVDVYANQGAVPATAICPGTGAGNVVDSMKGSWYYVDRAIFEDAQGGRVLAGGFTTGGLPDGNEGWWATKHDKNGQLLWSLYQNEVDYYSTYYQYPHIIIEQAVGDSAGNTYLMGHEMNQQYVTANGQSQTTVQSMADFLIKVSPTGQILWVKPFYSMDGSNAYQFCSGGTLLLGKGGASLYVVAERYPGSSYVAGSTTVLGAGAGQTGVIMQFDLNGNLLRSNSFLCPPVNLYNGLQGVTDNYWHAPPATFVNGNLVIYTTLYPSQGTLENASIGFSSTSIPEALAVFDTVGLHALKVLPVYSTVSGASAGVVPKAYAMDSTGSYYIDWNVAIPIPAPAYPYQEFPDTTQEETYIEGLSASGTVLWTKLADGLEPEKMLVFGSQLKVCGTNAPGMGWTDQQSGAAGQATLADSTVRRLTVVGVPGTKTGRGGYGLGSLDIVVATLQTSDGTMLDFLPMGSHLEDERMTMAKGAGNQIWVAGSVGSKYIECCGDVGYALYTYKLPITSDCYGGYPGQAPFLKWNIAADTTVCTDSLYTLNWSSTGTGTLSIRFSPDSGADYTSLVAGLQSGTNSYTYNAVTAGTLGKVEYIISDDSSSLADTTNRQLARTVMTSVSVTAGDTAICAGSPVLFTATAVNQGTAGVYQWQVNQSAVGANFDTITLSSLKDSDRVQVLVTGSLACSSPAVAVSNSITMHVTTGMAPAVSIKGATAGIAGKTDTLYAHAVQAGPTPAYGWQDSTVRHNWLGIAGATDSILYYIPADSGDKIRSIVGGNAPCSPVDSAVSNVLVMIVKTVAPPGDSTITTPPPPDSTATPSDSTAGTGQLYIFPNPAHSSITIDTLRLQDEWQTLDIVDMNGRQLMTMSILNQTTVNVQVDAFPKGIYVVRMNGRKRKAYLRFLKM